LIYSQLFTSQHGVTSQKTWIFDITAVRTSNLANPRSITAFYNFLLFSSITQTETHVHRIWCLVRSVRAFVAVMLLCFVFIITCWVRFWM